MNLIEEFPYSKSAAGEFNNSMDKKLEKFKIFFDEYQRILKEANLIDYDDMLISSVKLLEDNADIREYYQKSVNILLKTKLKIHLQFNKD